MTQILSQFKSIRLLASHNCQAALTDDQEIPKALSYALEDLWDTVEIYLETGNLDCINTFLENWRNTIREFDEYLSPENISGIINIIFINLWHTTSGNLTATQALNLQQALFPLVLHTNELITSQEVKRSGLEISDVLNKTRSNLEMVEQNKSKFIRIAAHELKTPLTIIDGYTAMLKENAGDIFPQISELIMGIETGAERLRIIVQDLIDVSLIDNRLLSLSIQPVWLNRLLRTLRLEFQGTFEKRNLTFHVFDFEGINEMIFADPDRLMQVFRNIISNAIKYTPNGGKITISGNKLPGFIEVIFTDTGIGISPEHQIIIFDKFTQLGESSKHSSSKTRFKGGGPGLGLHISKGIMDTMGGTIWVESGGHDEKNFPGSSFHVLIPLNQKNSKTNVEEFIQS